MYNQFRKDLAQAKGAEELVLKTFSSLSDAYIFEDVSNDCMSFYKGDIKATEKATGKEIYIEVKNDSRIADTQRVLCEEENYFKNYGYYKDGGMHNDTDIYVVVSASEQKIYVMDFDVLKKNYKSGYYMEINHPTQICYCYLLDLCRVKQYGGLIQIIDYKEMKLC